MKSGQVIGATDRIGGEVIARPVQFQEVFATLYHNLGIDLKSATVNDPQGDHISSLIQAFNPFGNLLVDHIPPPDSNLVLSITFSPGRPDISHDKTNQHLPQKFSPDFSRHTRHHGLPIFYWHLFFAEQITSLQPHSHWSHRIWQTSPPPDEQRSQTTGYPDRRHQ